MYINIEIIDKRKDSIFVICGTTNKFKIYPKRKTKIISSAKCYVIAERVGSEAKS